MRDRPGHPLLATGLMLLMCAMFASLDTLVRAVGGVATILVVLSWRYGVQALVMALWLARGGRRRFGTNRPGFQALRGALLLTTSALSYLGLQHMPVAEFTAVVLLGPAFVTVLAALALKEQVSPLRWGLVGLGLTGALIVVRPGSGLFGWVALLPLASAMVYAVFQTLTRKYALVEDPYATHFWTGAVGTAVIAPLLLVNAASVSATAAALTPLHWLALAGIGALGSTGHLMLVLATRLAPASTLMPFSYAQLGFATLLGWLAFDRWPDGWGWSGIGLIALSGATSAWLNMRRRPPVPAPPAPDIRDRAGS